MIIKTNYILLLILLITGNLIQAQEEKKSKFNLAVSGGIGYGLVDNDYEPNYNLNSNSIDVLLNYKIGKKFGIATGIGMYQLSGNGFNTIGNFYHERRVLANFGFFTQNITSDEYRFLYNSQKKIYDGWNFGAQFGLGFVFKLSDNFSAGLNYAENYEFTKFKSNNNQGINDKQKINNRNSIGILFIFQL